MTNTEDRINALFEELVPASGKADTVAGEIIRATCRIGYRWTNDGDQLGIGYGRETVNPAARYLAERTNDRIKQILSNMWDLYSEDIYEEGLERMCEAVLEYIEENPQLRTKENTEDFWDYRDAIEDVETWDDEDDGWMF